MGKACSAFEPTPILGSGPENSRMSGGGLAGFARPAMRTLVTGILHKTAVRRFVWRSKLGRLLDRLTPGVERRRRQTTQALLSDYALRDIGLTRVDYVVESQGCLGDHELGGGKPAHP